MGKLKRGCERVVETALQKRSTQVVRVLDN